MRERGKGERIHKMFNSIAPQYDQLNRLISLGMDQCWRDLTVKCIASQYPRRVLDLAAGTGDLSIAIAEAIPTTTVTAGDLSEGMLSFAQKKAIEKGLEKQIEICQCDAMNLPFSDGSFDVVTCAFGVRNFEGLQDGLIEMYRVTNEGGMVAILELCEPRNPIIKKFYRFHAFKVIPFLGSLLGSERSAYTYLPESVSKVPHRTEMLELMVNAGYVQTQYHIFVPGVCGLYIGFRPYE